MKAILTLAIFMFGACANSQSIISTYALGDIPTSYNAYDATCNGPDSTVVITLPPVGLHTISSIDVVYDFTATGAAWIEDQRSQIHCQNTSLTEAIFSGSIQNPSTEYYNRTGVNMANGV